MPETPKKGSIIVSRSEHEGKSTLMFVDFNGTPEDGQFEEAFNKIAEIVNERGAASSIYVAVFAVGYSGNFQPDATFLNQAGAVISNNITRLNGQRIHLVVYGERNVYINMVMNIIGQTLGSNTLFTDSAEVLNAVLLEQYGLKTNF